MHINNNDSIKIIYKNIIIMNFNIFNYSNLILFLYFDWVAYYSQVMTKEEKGKGKGVGERRGREGEEDEEEKGKGGIWEERGREKGGIGEGEGAIKGFIICTTIKAALHNNYYIAHEMHSYLTHRNLLN